MLDEETDSQYLDEKTVYTYINKAGLYMARKTNALTATQSITTVADQSDYTLNADFIKLYLKNKQDLFIKYNDGSSDTFINQGKYEDIVYMNNSDSVTIPERFAITDDRTLDSRVTGTATSAGAKDSGSGEATLTDSAADFSDVSAGDVVHNTTDSSSGFVISKTSSTVLVTALFPDDPSGTAEQDWDSSDAYVIQPQGRYKIVLDPPPSTGGHTVTVEYIQRPAPLYSNFGTFRFPSELNDAVVFYTAWLLKYRDREPNFGDRYFIMADQQLRENKREMDVARNRRGIPVNLKARR